ncbi:hypothetical protein SDC9_137303 [bioreactor metagenome]|uniref:Uncharacterized protein n=1 Tax=bioreactor metagenome TaxID=1076179 RepID=A0A645DLI1_9ZZZZ
MIRIGISDVAELCFRFLRTSQPLIPGSITSRVITDGFSSRASKIASFPLETAVTLYPASVSVIVRSSLDMSSSSTIITRSPFPEPPAGSIISGVIVSVFVSGFTFLSGSAFSVTCGTIFSETSEEFENTSGAFPYFKGNSNEKVEPFPASLSTHTLPP